MAVETKEFRKKIAEQFINSLKENPEHWQRQWSVAGTRPENCVSHTPYRGINRFNLTFEAIRKGSKDMRWATFKQIQQQGWHLKKGAKSVLVEFWQPYNKQIHSTVSWDEYNKAENPDDYTLLSRYYHVFNAADIEGIPPMKEVHNNITQHEAIDRIISGMGIEVKNDGADRAYYNVTNDTVHLPSKELFVSDNAYNSTLLHELSHATGAETRLDRPQSGIKSTVEYAIEELIAEISSCFTGADIGIQYENADIKNHKAYVQSWISQIENKPEVLFDAIRQADRAADYLLEKGGLLQENTKEAAPAETSEKKQADDNERTPETIAINKELKIVRLNGKLTFRHGLGYINPKGYCFVHPEKGYLALGGDHAPYTPRGGKDALQSIQDTGGFLSFETMSWVKPADAEIAACKQFIDDLCANGFRVTARLQKNYYALAEARENEAFPSLSDISVEYNSGSTDKYINEIGNELKGQELQRLEEMEQCR